MLERWPLWSLTGSAGCRQQPPAADWRPGPHSIGIRALPARTREHGKEAVT